MHALKGAAGSRAASPGVHPGPESRLRASQIIGCPVLVFIDMH